MKYRIISWTKLFLWTLIWKRWIVICSFFLVVRQDLLKSVLTIRTRITYLLNLIIVIFFSSLKKMLKRSILENSYVPSYARDYDKLPWYKRDLIAYFNRLDYKEMADNHTKYFRCKRVVNFDIIHFECRGDQLKYLYKHYKTVKQEELKNENNWKKNKKEKNEALSGVFRKVKRADLWVQRNLMLEYFLKII